MDQSPAAFFCAADETDNGYRGATGFRGFGDFSVDCLLLTGSGGGGENLLPTCVLCHVSRCTTALERGSRLARWPHEQCASAVHLGTAHLTPWQRRGGPASP